VDALAEKILIFNSLKKFLLSLYMEIVMLPLEKEVMMDIFRGRQVLEL
jgi:hypothetical protein